MKKFFLILVPFLLNSCKYFSPLKLMKETKLKNGTIIQVLYMRGDATVSEAVWIKAIPLKSKSYYSAMIDEFSDSYQTNITEIDTLHINVQLIDPSLSKNNKFDFVVNLSDTIHPSGPFF